MKIQTAHLGKLRDISRKRENESPRLQELMKRLETMIAIRERRAQSTAQEAA
jgi:hypothetical protein